jgi:hypothetical protein
MVPGLSKQFGKKTLVKGSPVAPTFVKELGPEQKF